MAFDFNNSPVQRQSAILGTDPGLRAYMIRVYNYMAMGLGISMFVAYAASTNLSLMKTLFQTNLYIVVMIAPFAMVLFLGHAIHRLSPAAALGSFIGYSALMGLSISAFFLIYTQQSISSIFLVSMAMFLSMSIYGYVTKKDLTSMGSFLIMGVWGLVLSMLINVFFLHNGMLDLFLSCVAVLLFTGLTAYDMQAIRLSYTEDSREEQTKIAVMGALRLYLDFINIFLSMLRIFGNRR